MITLTTPSKSQPGVKILVDITEEQYQAGQAAYEANPGKHYPVWVALRDAGVPVRGANGETPASTAATRIAEANVGFTYI